MATVEKSNLILKARLDEEKGEILVIIPESKTEVLSEKYFLVISKICFDDELKLTYYKEDLRKKNVCLINSIRKEKVKTAFNKIVDECHLN